jgi:Na+-transporting NADH:ubiquinone oxidoreductase subunit NqrD
LATCHDPIEDFVDGSIATGSDDGIETFLASFQGEFFGMPRVLGRDLFNAVGLRG